MENKGLYLDAQKVLLAMAYKNMTVKELCDNANINNGTYQRIAKGQVLTPKTVGKIAKALDVKVEDLL